MKLLITLAVVGLVFLWYRNVKEQFGGLREYVKFLKDWYW